MPDHRVSPGACSRDLRSNGKAAPKSPAGTRRYAQNVVWSYSAFLATFHGISVLSQFSMIHHSSAFELFRTRRWIYNSK